MKRSLLTAILLAATALNAAAQRVSLDVPLSPSLNLSAAASVSPLAQTFPLALSPWTPSLTAPSIQIPFNAVPVPAALTVKAAASMPAPLTTSALKPGALTPVALAASKPVIHQQGPKLLDNLKKHGAESGKLSGLQGENGKGALENNFLSAAALGDGTVTPAGGDEVKRNSSENVRPLLERMLEKVRLDDRGRADEKKALEDSFKRMLETPTGREYAEQFLAEGLTAHVHFEDFPDSQLYLVEGRKKFYAAQAYTDWKQEGYAEIRLNRHYVDGDPEFMRDSLPSIIGHELLGHGLWYGRAAKEDLYLAFHYHELNETLARLVGWSIDHEMDGRFEEAGAWTYLSDPAHYLANLKMRLPYYAVTFGHKEMADPLGTLRARLALAEQEVQRAHQNLAAQKTWIPVLDHFSSGHGVPTARFELLRKELSDLESHYQNEIVNAESIVREVAALIGRIEAEPDHASEIYLKQSSLHPFFERLSADTERLGAALTKAASSAPVVEPRPASPRPADQFTWDDLSKMYQDDVAADAKRLVKHWR